MKQLYYSLLSTLILLTTHLSCQASESMIGTELPVKYSVVGSGYSYPYYSKDPNREGIVPDIIKLIFDDSNIISKEIIYPPGRIEPSFDKKSLDLDIFNPQWMVNKDERSLYAFSLSIIPFEDHIVYLTTTKAAIFIQGKLFDKDIGTVRGYSYGDNTVIKRVDFHSEKALIQALKLNRLEYIICNKNIAKHWAKQLSVSIEIGPVYSEGFLHIRLRKKLKHLLPRINQSINKLIENGEINKVLQSYLSNLN